LFVHLRYDHWEGRQAQTIWTQAFKSTHHVHLEMGIECKLELLITQLLSFYASIVSYHVITDMVYTSIGVRCTSHSVILHRVSPIGCHCV
jgi:hypothetical protein